MIEAGPAKFCGDGFAFEKDYAFHGDSCQKPDCQGGLH